MQLKYGTIHVFVHEEITFGSLKRQAKYDPDTYT